MIMAGYDSLTFLFSSAEIIFFVFSHVPLSCLPSLFILSFVENHFLEIILRSSVVMSFHDFHDYLSW